MVHKIQKQKALRKKKDKKEKKESWFVIIVKAISKIISSILKAIYWTFKHLFLLIFSIFKKSKENKKERKLKDKLKKKKPIIDNSVNFSEFKLLETIEGSYDKFIDFIYTKKSTIGIILGARGTGKSAIGMRILENMHAKIKRPCYAMGFNQEDLPKFIHAVENVDEITNNSIVLIDEGGILFSARDAMKKANKLLSQLLLIARHKDLSILFISQNSANLEINIIRQADYLLLKPSSLLQKDFERKKIKKIYEEAAEKFKKYEDDKGLTYVYSHHFRGFISNSLPSFWSQKISKAFNKK